MKRIRRGLELCFLIICQQGNRETHHDLRIQAEGLQDRNPSHLMSNRKGP